jgi:hypothetical protein
MEVDEKGRDATLAVGAGASPGAVKNNSSGNSGAVKSNSSVIL